MTLTTHAVVGAAAASFFPAHPYAAFAAGFASHFVIDALPHWDYVLRSARKDVGRPLETDMSSDHAGFVRDLCSIGLDASLGFLLTFAVAWFLQVPLWLTLIGAGAGVYPDLLSFLYFKARRAAPRLAWAYGPVQYFHVAFVQRWEWKGEGWQLGIALQALLMTAVLAGAKFFR